MSGNGGYDQYVWENVGAQGFAYSEGKPSLALAGSTVHLLFADESDPGNPLRAMVHDGGHGDWTSVGTHISVGAPPGDIGDDTQLYVMKSTGTDWTSVGLSNGVAIYDDEHAVTIHKFGTYPSLVSYGSDDYRPADSIGGFETALVLDTGGNLVAALQRGGGATAPTAEFYRYSSDSNESWESHLDIFDAADGSNQLDLRGFLMDSGNTPYLAYETLTYGDPPLTRSDIARWNGTAWSELAFCEAIHNINTERSTEWILATSDGRNWARLWRTIAWRLSRANA